MFNCLNYLGEKQIKLQAQSKVCKYFRARLVNADELTISVLIAHLLKAMKTSL